MRLGGSVMKPYKTPSEWLGHVKELGYSAVIFPVDHTAPKQLRRDYQKCAQDNGLVIAEVGIWKNVMARDAGEQAAAFERSVRQLELAEDIGAECCVNISGSLGARWDGFHPDQDTRACYEAVVEMTQSIIDAVKPTHTKFSLEPMPWMFPESPEDYLDLIRDVDRPCFAAHLDYANMINSISRYRKSGEFIGHCFDVLGEHILSIHAKDVKIDDGHLPLNINEVPPGQGVIDYGLVLRRAHALGPDTPVVIEHLPDHEAYMAASRHVLSVAEQAGVPVVHI